MASSFSLSIATRATTQRNNAESVGTTIDNPGNLFECPSGLDSVGSDTPYYNPGVSRAAIKIEPGTTAASVQVFIESKEPLNLIDEDLTDYLDESVPSPKSVEHAVEDEPLSAIDEPPTTGGNNPALSRLQSMSNPSKASYEGTPAMEQVQLPTEPPPPPTPFLSYAQCVSKGGKAPPPFLPPHSAEGPALPSSLDTP